MTKLKGMLDQETWVEVDVPNEFQGIVDSLFSLESLGVGDSDDKSYNEQAVDGIMDTTGQVEFINRMKLIITFYLFEEWFNFCVLG